MNGEAIKKLKDILEEVTETDDSVCYVTSDDTDALKAAIKALEIQPCDDSISRQAVLDNAYAYGNGLEPEGYCVNVEDIQALPPVIPQPFINKPCISEGVCREDKMQVLDKIRAEIEDLTYYCCEVHPRTVIDDVLDIIDKYKAESEIEE